ncbi:MAG: response regulator, partial [Bacteroidetes bacterium]|nr:response regulator [Candidatus Gallipaludibacter merdavium]
MKLSCFIIDDEPLALGLLETYVNRTDFLVLTGKYSSALAAVEAICQERPNLVFLDIQMADLNGLEFAKSIPSDTRIIFTTAFEQYALESYRLNALDYLLKPFSYADFLRAATKALQWYELKHKAEEMGGDVVKDSVFIKVDYKLVRLEIRRILYYCCPINSIKYKNSTARALCIQWSSFILSIQAPSKYGQLTILFL